MRNKALILFGILLIPKICYASGDPSILYSLVSFCIIHIGMFLYLVLAKAYARFRYPILGLFIVNVILTWLWGFNLPGPDFTEMYIGLFTFPLISFLCLIWLKKYIASPKGL